MFRRNRGQAGPKWFTRQVSGSITATVPTGSGAATAVIDGILLTPEGLVGVAAAHAIKQVDISAVSWTSDYVQSGGDAAIGFDQTRWCAEAIYVDALTEGGVPVRDATPFLNLISLAATQELDDFPLRIVHRRRFTLDQLDLSGSGGSNFAANAAYLTPGFGTERHIRRRMRIRPNEALLWRLEIYDWTGGVTTDTTVEGDLLAAISYRVVT